jgi:hypothetical protein
MILRTKLPLLNIVFSNHGFAQLFKQSTLSELSDQGKDSIYTLAEIVSDVKIDRVEPFGFQSISDLRGLEYVGYIIEKERLDRTNFSWIRLEDIRVVGNTSGGFIDTRVMYGECYRYRIKTIVRVTKRLLVSETQVNVGQSAESLLAQKLKDAIETYRQILESQPVGAEFHLFENYYLKVTQTDIILYQKEVNQSAVSITLADLLSGNSNVYLPIVRSLLIKTNITYQSFYYESLPSKEWTYIDAYETEPPPPPESIRLIQSTPNRTVTVTWLKPVNSQRDIKAYRVYRRGKIGEQWVLIKEITELDVNGDGIPDAPSALANSPGLYVDSNLNINEKYIYALTCVDIHGIESFLSTQIQVELNPNFEIEKQEIKQKWISGSGAKPSEINSVYKKLLNRTEQIVAKRNIKITPNTKFAETKKDFLIRFKSLDTGEKFEIPLRLYNEKV